ncbi:MAG: hypothetical protein QXW07_03475 [Candidatus Woesearchaeota archaeon]
MPDYKQNWRNKMLTDIVIPKQDEKDFIIRARSLGYKGIMLLYHPKEYEEKLQLLREISGLYQDFSISAGILIESTKAKNINQYNRRFNCAMIGRGFSPNFFKKNQVSMIFELETSSTGSSKYRSSGLNQVLCSEAIRNGKAIGISASQILENEASSEILGRILRNIKIAQTYKVPIRAASLAETPDNMRNPYDILSLLRELGLNRNMNELFQEPELKNKFIYSKQDEDKNA